MILDGLMRVKHRLGDPLRFQTLVTVLWVLQRDYSHRIGKATKIGVILHDRQTIESGRKFVDTIGVIFMGSPLGGRNDEIRSDFGNLGHDPFPEVPGTTGGEKRVAEHTRQT